MNHESTTQTPATEVRRAHRRSRPAALSFGMAALVSAVLAAPAAANTYTINICSDGSNPVQVPSDLVTTPGSATTTNTCGSGGGLSLVPPSYVLTQPENWAAMAVSLTLPASTPNSWIESAWGQFSMAPKNGDYYSWGQIGWWSSNGDVGQPITWPGGDYGGFSRWGFSAAAADLPTHARWLAWNVTCYGPCGFSGPPITMHRVALAIEDPQSPTGATAASTGLLAGGAQTGARKLTLSAHDADSGVLDIAVLDAAGKTLASQRTPGCSWTRPVVCEQNPETEFSIDTTKLPEGVQTLSARITDAAGNARTVELPAFVVDNVPAPRPKQDPEMHGNVRVGLPVSAVDGTWEGYGKPVALTRTWQVSTDDGATWQALADGGEVLTPDASLEGKLLRLAVTGSTSEGSATAYSKPPVRVQAANSSGTDVVVAPTPAAHAPVQLPAAHAPVALPQAEQVAALRADNGVGGDPASGQIVQITKTRVRTSYGHRVVLKGKLVDAAGLALRGATVAVVDQPAATGARAIISTATTDDQGVWRVKETVRGSRQVAVRYSRQRGSNVYQAVAKYDIQVRAKVTVRLASSRIRGGGRATLRGQVRLQGLRSGSIVEIQASDRGRWLTTGAVRTNRRGQFVWKHRFAIHSGKIRFRALLKKQASVPGPASTSSSATLHIG